MVRDNRVISNEVTRFYNELYTKDVEERSFLQGLNWSPLDSTKGSWLERPFKEEKVRSAI